jgi:hypothetical protein
VAIVLSVVWFLVAIVLSDLVSCGHSIVCGLVPPLISKELFLYKKIFHKKPDNTRVTRNQTTDNTMATRNQTRQYNGHNKKYKKKTSNGRQNSTQKNKD